MSANSQVSSASKQLTAEEAIQRSRGTLELASRALEGGRGGQAATILEMGARELEMTARRVSASGRSVLDLLADTMWARAESYKQLAPRPLCEKAGELIAVSRKVMTFGKGIRLSHPQWSRLLEGIATESLVQAEFLLQAAENTEVMIGRGVSQAYRAIVSASFDKMPIEQNPEIPGANVPGVKKPDYRIGSELFDNYAPTTNSARNIWKTVVGKVEAEQARRIVLNLDDSAVDLAALQKQFKDWRIEGLEQVLVVKNGNVTPLILPKKPATGMTPKGYPDQRE